MENGKKKWNPIIGGIIGKWRQNERDEQVSCPGKINLFEKAKATNIVLGQRHYKLQVYKLFELTPCPWAELMTTVNITKTAAMLFKLEQKKQNSGNTLVSAKKSYFLYLRLSINLKFVEHFLLDTIKVYKQYEKYE